MFWMSSSSHGMATLAVATVLMLSVDRGSFAQQRTRPELPEPDHANVSYGPHERNVRDLWLAESETPTPLVIFIHGGGTHLSADDHVPVLMTYGSGDVPIDDETPIGVIIHHPKFGIVLKEKMDELGLECVVTYRDRPGGRPRVSIGSFLLEHLLDDDGSTGI